MIALDCIVKITLAKQANR